MSQKKINIVCASALPWFTGTSLNPLWRSIYLARLGHEVTLYLPWIEQNMQKYIYPANTCFSSIEEQINYILNWIPEEFKNPTFKIEFYPAAYYKNYGSIYPSINLDKKIEPCEILILEEPEHLLLKQRNVNLRKIAPKIVGICHTHYQQYFPVLISVKLRDIFFKLSNYQKRVQCSVYNRLRSIRFRGR